MTSHQGSYPSEIQERVRKGYINRLHDRVQKMRRNLADRNWQELRQECVHLKTTATTFDLPDLAGLAAKVERAIPESCRSSATGLPEAKEAAENLFSEVDRLK
jgi:HPt (histidine-containing phosphotransfer) domain-containing protein